MPARLVLVSGFVRSLLSFAVTGALVALAACHSGGSAEDPLGVGDDQGGDDDPDGDRPTSPSSFCTDNSQCALSASACCGCPSFATSTNDPAVDACGGVTCPTDPTCMKNVRAACDLPSNECVLQCIELECAQTFDAGFAMDPATGCLACMPAGIATVTSCADDADCVQTREDCCGCANGGEDIAVLASERAGFDASLGCPATPTCPGVNTCEAGATPRCVQGACTLTTATAPFNACGRSDLPNGGECPGEEVCILNRDPAATELGVGVCASI